MNTLRQCDQMCSIFGHLQQWTCSQLPKKVQKFASKLCQVLNKPKNLEKTFKILSKRQKLVTLTMPDQQYFTWENYFNFWAKSSIVFPRAAAWWSRWPASRRSPCLRTRTGTSGSASTGPSSPPSKRTSGRCSFSGRRRTERRRKDDEERCVKIAR